MKTAKMMAMVVVLGLMAVTPRVMGAANEFFWTNSVDGASGYWTNTALWTSNNHTTAATIYPGQGASSTVYFTNSFSGSYTSIYNFTTANAIGTLTLSNTAGSAWLVVTQATLTVTTFNLNNGGRLRIDNGGQVTATTLNWAGTTGVIYINNNGTLQTTGFGMNSSSVTGLVSNTTGSGGCGTSMVARSMWDSSAVPGKPEATNCPLTGSRCRRVRSWWANLQALLVGP